MTDEIHFVQCLHPGAEHRPPRGSVMPWNCGPHRRKFVQQCGRCRLTPDDEAGLEGDLHFWAEWEPESALIREFDGDSDGWPRYLHKPLFIARDTHAGLQNTDPFVFGDRFYYCICQQRGVMQRLDRGSVILFGSCRRNSFALDTVFVVASWEPYDRDNYRQLNVPAVYRDVALAPLFAGSGSDSCQNKTCGEGVLARLYHGATVDAPVEGMFSFFPCLQAEESVGFARPVICLPGVITNNLSQGFRAGPKIDVDTSHHLWSEVVRQVLDHRLAIGIYAELTVDQEALPVPNWTHQCCSGTD